MSENLCVAGFALPCGSQPCETCGAKSDEACREYPRQLERKLAAAESTASALRAELAAARTVADGEVRNAINNMAEACCCEEPGKPCVPCRTANLLSRLSAAKKEAERERDEARPALAQAREQIAILRAPIDEALAECGHSSDCAVYNMPALPNGPCNCWQSKFSALAQGEQ